MQQLVDLFGFLSVVLRAGTLIFQSLLLGGIVFILWTARDVPGNPESILKVQSGSWTLLRLCTIGLIVMQVLYLYVNSAVLMTTAEIGFRGVIGANFFISGSIVLVASGVDLFGGTPAVEVRTLAATPTGDDRAGRIGHDEPRRFAP